MNLSILDQSPIRQGVTAEQAFQETLALAKEAERLGYRRFWVSEHHNAHCLAGSSPEVLLAAIGAATEDMRIGSGGVMLPYYSPFKVAESFSVLTNLYPDRVDLGVGRAPGGDMKTARMLAPGAGTPVRAVPRTCSPAGGDPAEPGFRTAGHAPHPVSAPRVDARIQPRKRHAGRPAGTPLQFRPVHQQQHRPAHPGVLPALFRAFRPDAAARGLHRDQCHLRRQRGGGRQARPEPRPALRPLRVGKAQQRRTHRGRGRKAPFQRGPSAPFWTTSSAWRPWAVRTRSGDTIDRLAETFGAE